MKNPIEVSPALMRVLSDIAAERARQDAKWGRETLKTLADGTGGPHRDIAEAAAKDRCNRRMREGKCTFADIVEEEIAEALAAPANSPSLRTELVQGAAVLAKWIEAIDMRGSEL